MKKRRILFIAAAAACAAVLLFIGITTAYFTEVEVKDNEITIGKVAITLDEGAFDPETTYPVVPGSVVQKAPKLTNSGNRDEFVFMKISVPKAAVTLLNEDGSGKGTPRDDLANVPQQLFKLAASAAPGTAQPVPAVEGRDIAFTYHAGSTSTDGWVLLESKTSGADADVYVFGYNKNMKPGDETVTLFDTVQLKSFIDKEKTGGTSIGVTCYGIQKEYLKPESGVDFTAAHYDADALNKIYTIVKNKAGGQQ